MKYIVKVASLQNLPDTRPLIAMDQNGDMIWYAAVQASDFIDLGLSVKWRNRNIGANSITDYGNYYAWGELETKTYYDWTDPNDSTQNYKYANGDYNTLTKYCPTDKTDYWDGEPAGTPDNKLSLEIMDDIAYQTDNSWRMPTKAEYEELMTCQNEWVENYEGSGVNGRVFYKIDITPATKVIDLYTVFDENMQPVQQPSLITNNMWQTLSMYTEEELDTMLSELTGGTITDIRTIIYKDANGTVADYGTDYTLTTKVVDQSVNIFIPASGNKYQDQFNDDGSRCYLWSSSLNADDPDCAWDLGFGSGYIGMGIDHRDYGFTVRPVQD